MPVSYLCGWAGPQLGMQGPSQGAILQVAGAGLSSLPSHLPYILRAQHGCSGNTPPTVSLFPVLGCGWEGVGCVCVCVCVASRQRHRLPSACHHPTPCTTWWFAGLDGSRVLADLGHLNLFSR